MTAEMNKRQAGKRRDAAHRMCVSTQFRAK